jgi:hypothetical protein
MSPSVAHFHRHIVSPHRNNKHNKHKTWDEGRNKQRKIKHVFKSVYNGCQAGLHNKKSEGIEQSLCILKLKFTLFIKFNLLHETRPSISGWLTTDRTTGVWFPPRPDRLWNNRGLVSNEFWWLFSRGLKQPERKDDHTLHLVRRLRMRGATPPRTILRIFYGVVFKNRENITYTKIAKWLVFLQIRSN